MRIASLLPSATEIVFAVGAGDEVVGVSHECDYPVGARGLPVLTGSAVETRGLPQAEIDAAISSLLASGGSTYTIDVPRLRELRPDLVITQALCDVCAVSEGQVHRVVHEEQLGARVLTLTPLDLEGVARSVEEVGDATGHAPEATRLALDLRERIAARAPTPSTTPRVLALEWLDPPFAAGHWVPEQIARAGGADVLGQPGRKSERVTWEAIAATAPMSPSSSPAASPSTRSWVKQRPSPSAPSGAPSPPSPTGPSGRSTRTPGSAAPAPACSTVSKPSAPSSPTPPATTPSPAPAASPPPDQGVCPMVPC